MLRTKVKRRNLSTQIQIRVARVRRRREHAASSASQHASHYHLSIRDGLAVSSAATDGRKRQLNPFICRIRRKAEETAGPHGIRSVRRAWASTWRRAISARIAATRPLPPLPPLPFGTGKGVRIANSWPGVFFNSLRRSK